MREGQTGLVLRVPDAEPVVGRWRTTLDSSAPLGVPAHVTVLYPWIPFADLTDDDRAGLADIAGATGPFRLTFATVGRFSDVLWLDPRPREPILALVAALTARWPGYLPYGGEFGSALTPHLTVADSCQPDELGHVVADLESALPITARIDELSLFVRGTDRWSLAATFRFG